MTSINIDLYLGDFKTLNRAQYWFKRKGIRIKFLEQNGGADTYKMSGSKRDIIHYLSNHHKLNNNEISNLLKQNY